MVKSFELLRRKVQEALMPSTEGTRARRGTILHHMLFSKQERLSYIFKIVKQNNPALKSVSVFLIHRLKGGPFFRLRQFFVCRHGHLFPQVQ